MRVAKAKNVPIASLRMEFLLVAGCADIVSAPPEPGFGRSPHSFAGKR
jgi:hypothetical protein